MILDSGYYMVDSCSFIILYLILISYKDFTQTKIMTPPKQEERYQLSQISLKLKHMFS